MGKDKHKKDNLLIQFRTGTNIGRHVRAMSRRWKISTNEAGRRLVVLALLGLTRDQYDAIRPLEEGPGVDDFAGACGQAVVALDVHERMAGKPIGPEERLAFLTNWATTFVAHHGTDDPPPAEPVVQGPSPTKLGHQARRRRVITLDT